MPLVEIWEKTPEQLQEKTIQQVLVFAGDGRLKDGNSTSVEFREFLAHIPSEDLSTFANQCLEVSFQDSGLALQDIANQVGKRLGFTVEDGRYRGTTTAIGFDGLWHSKGGETILIEVKTTDAYRLSLDRGRARLRAIVRFSVSLKVKWCRGWACPGVAGDAPGFARLRRGRLRSSLRYERSLVDAPGLEPGTPSV
jgi:hypothetical protein